MAAQRPVDGLVRSGHRGKMVGSRDAQALPLGSRIANLDYPLHAAKVGGLAYRLVMTVSGLTLAFLGTLAVVTFWGNPTGNPKRSRRGRGTRCLGGRRGRVSIHHLGQHGQRHAAGRNKNGPALDGARPFETHSVEGSENLSRRGEPAPDVRDVPGLPG
jgi:hypothetical protein